MKRCPKKPTQPTISVDDLVVLMWSRFEQLLVDTGKEVP